MYIKLRIYSPVIIACYSSVNGDDGGIRDETWGKVHNILNECNAKKKEFG